MKYTVYSEKRIKEYAADNINHIINDYVKLERSGVNLVGKCPFHEEETGSFFVSRTKKIYKCFGCGKSGDAISFIMDYKNMTYIEALQMIANKSNIKLEEEIPTPTKKETFKSFIEKRKINSSSIEKFRLTEAVTWMPKSNKKVSTVAFPFFDGDTVVNVQYRSYEKDFKFSKGGRLTWYNINASKGTILYIVEGLIDCITISQCGYPCVVSTPNGTNGTEYWSDIDFSKINKVYLAGDNDEPGKKLMESLANYIGREKCYLIEWIEGCKDANETYVKHGQGGVVISIEQAVPMSEVPIADSFPFDIFDEDVYESFKELANHYSIPIEFLGTTALWLVSALAGNMYKTELGSKTKCIVYAMMLGPSSLGKSVAYRILCEDVLQDLEIAAHRQYEVAKKKWEQESMAARLNKWQFDTPKPQRIIRIATNATTEAIIYYATFNPAGFGMYFDEGKSLYSGGAYKKENNSVDFWNKCFDGSTFNELRVDSDRERFVTNPAISVLAGMQSDRITEMFNKDTRDSGLFNRFLFCESGHIQLNEKIDHFGPNKRVSGRWSIIVRALHQNGLQYEPNNQINIPFSEEARAEYNKVSKRITKEANELKKQIKGGDHTEAILSYWGKAYGYFSRFIPICAIIHNYNNPIVTVEIVQRAERLYYYYRNQAKRVLYRVLNQEQSDLNETQEALFNALPDKFDARAAQEVCANLNLTKKYFSTTFRRKYQRGYIKKVGNFYEKL